MGQVFTWDSIHSGKIPKIESFHRVASVLREIFSVEPSIVCASLFGSVVRGDFNIRSDVDCVVIYMTHRQSEAMRAMYKANRIASALHVRLTIAPCDTVLARTRLHHLSTSFVQHLQASIDAGGLIKGNLADLLAPTIPVPDEIESYIKMKMYSLQESMVQMTYFSEERFAAFLKKAFEAPTHVARKMLIYEGTLGGDSKKEVRDEYKRTMPRTLSGELDCLLKADQSYSAALERQLETPDRDAYDVTLEALQGKIPMVLKFLRSNILRLHGAR